MAESGQARHTPSLSLHGGAAWEIVRHWPDLRGESKLAWLGLWQRTGGKPGTLVITASLIGEDQGTGERSGRRALENLAVEGLIYVIARENGRWTVDVKDPGGERRARLSRLVSDGQRDLFPSSAPESQPPVEPAPILPSPFSAPPGGGCGATSAVEPSPSLSLESLRDKDKESLVLSCTSLRHAGRDGGCGATSAEKPQPRQPAPPPPPEPIPTLGGVFGQILRRLPTEEERQVRADELIAWIKREVSDPTLQDSPCIRIAWAIVNGILPHSELTRIIRALNKRQGLKSRSAYFIFAARDTMTKKYALDWNKDPAGETHIPPSPEKGHPRHDDDNIPLP